MGISPDNTSRLCSRTPGRGSSMLMDEYAAVPTKRTGELGSWGEYELRPLVIHEGPDDPRVVKERDPLVIVHFADDSRLTNHGISVVMRKSKAKYGMI